MATRKKKRGRARFDRCVKKVRRRSKTVNPYAVCTVALKHRRNPRYFRVSLYARAPDHTVLKYIGGIKFARKGTPAYFANRSHAMTVARQLRSQFPVLKRFKLFAQ